MKRGRVGTRTKLLEPLVDVPFECVMEPVERTLQNYHLDKNNDHEALWADARNGIGLAPKHHAEEWETQSPLKAKPYRHWRRAQMCLSRMPRRLLHGSRASRDRGDVSSATVLCGPLNTHTPTRQTKSETRPCRHS